MKHVSVLLIAAAMAGAQPGEPENPLAGTVSTAGGVVFFGDDDGQFLAIDSTNGRHLWHYNLGQPVFASPVTYEVDGKQYVTIASQTDVFTFGLFEPASSVPVLPGLTEP